MLASKKFLLNEEVIKLRIILVYKNSVENVKQRWNDCFQSMCYTDI